MEQITNHIERMIALLPAFQKLSSETKNLASHMEIKGKYFQELEDVAFLLLAQKILKTATDIHLEHLGKLVGQPRPLTGTASTNDDSYRALIYAKIASNTSHSLRDDIISILKILGENLPKLRNLYPATLYVEYEKAKIPNTFLTPTEVKNILQNASAPINIQVTAKPTTPFGFIGNPKTYGFNQGKLSEGVPDAN